MGLSGELESKKAEEMEQWFLDALGRDEMPFPDMLSVLSHFHESGNAGQADDWMDLLLEALAERSDRLRALSAMDLYCDWHGHRDDTAEACVEKLAVHFKDRLGSAIFKNAGFDRRVSAKECVRRLGVLSRLAPGVFCCDHTWGFGVVAGIDEFYEKVTIDFDGKAGHEMSFAYAAEALDLVGEDHILSIRHADPGRLEELVRSDPAEVVRLALRSYGPVNAARLKELLVDRVCSEEEWKSFWANARKVLKEDPYVDFPSKRNDPIRLLDHKKSYDAEWMAGLKKERDPLKIIETGEEIEKTSDLQNVPEDVLATFAERLCFAVRGVESKRHDLLARALMIGLQLGLTVDSSGAGGAASGKIGIDAEAITRGFLDAERFVGAVSGMHSRRLRDFLGRVADFEPEAGPEMMVSVLPLLQSGALNETILFLISRGREEDCAEKFRLAFASRTIGGEMLCWVCRHLDEAAGWSLPDISEIMICIVELLEDPASNENLKSKNQLRSVLEHRGWLVSALGRLDEEGRERLLGKLKERTDSVMRRSLMAMLIKLYPALQKAVELAGAEPNEQQQVRITSWRSYRERQEQLRKLVEETIPENSREIGIARSYGDLRENYEYKAARERQGLLFRRRSDLEEDLKNVKGADFEAAPLDKVGAGTTVRLVFGDGSEKRYAILGEWDSDEKLGIISCKTPLAEKLAGHRAGDVLDIGSAGKEETCTIMEIAGLDNEMRRWIKGKQAV